MHPNPKQKSEFGLRIKTVRALAYRLDLPEDLIFLESRRAGRNYSPFISRNEPRPFAKLPTVFKERTIDNPVEATKFIQARIYQKLLQPLPWPEHIFGGVKGKSLLHNIRLHLAAPVIVTVDIRSFFPSISTHQIYAVWANLLDCSPEIAGILTRLTTYDFRLPQGAATSSALANLVLYSLDQPIRQYCKHACIHYSTWIDDLAFSGETARHAINITVEALRRGGFALPHRKMKIMPAHQQQRLTGLLLNRQPGILKSYESATRSGIHKLATGQIPRFKQEAYARSLQGQITYIRMINPRRAQPLALRLMSALNASEVHYV
jgi:RNA-directed DNA polymerase